ncbi:MAG: hypothetical protein ACREE4_14985 [Stellaceae bacterium]
MIGEAPANRRVIETDIPARLDRLPWSGFHTLVVVALGITWVLGGLEVTLAGAIAGALEESPVLRFTAAEVGLTASAYLIGDVAGAVLFGYLVSAGLMVGAALVELAIGSKAERMPLERVARPLSSLGDEPRAGRSEKCPTLRGGSHRPSHSQSRNISEVE